MAIIDTTAGTVVLRVVYDGAPEAGKTTSVVALAGGLSRPVYTPDQPGERTLFFDWMDYTGGLFEGMRIRCQVVSVPGQALLAARRAALIQTADVVVLVASCTQDSVESVIAELQRLRRELAVLGSPSPGVLLQINKRDAADAIPLAALRARLDSAGLQVGVVESIATRGQGVREAFVFAVRLGLDRVRELKRLGTLRAEAVEVEDGEDLLKQILAQDAAPVWTVPATRRRSTPAEPYSLLATSHLEDHEAPERQPFAAESAGAESAEAESAEVESAAAESAAAESAAAEPVEPEPAGSASELSTLPKVQDKPNRTTDEHTESSSRDEELSEDSAASPGAASPVAGRPLAEALLDAAALSTPEFTQRSPNVEEVPLLPDQHIPSGMIWPPVEGRIALADATADPLTAQRARDGWLVLVGDRWLLHSATDAEYTDVNRARAELVAWARHHASLASLLSGPRSVVVAPSGSGTWRVWQIVKRRDSLRDLAANSLHLDRPGAVIEALVKIGRRLVEFERTRVHTPHNLPCALDTVGDHDGRVQYLGLMPASAALGEVDESARSNILVRLMRPLLGDWAQRRDVLLPAIQEHSYQRSSDINKDVVKQLENLFRSL